MTTDFDEAVEHFRRVFEDLFDLIGNYPVDRRETAGVDGRHSPREVLAQLCGWLEEAQRRYTQFDDGIPGDVDYADERFNTQSIQARAHYSWNSTVAELRGLTRDLIARAEALPTERAAADRRYGEWLHSIAGTCADHHVRLRAFAQADV